MGALWDTYETQRGRAHETFPGGFIAVKDSQAFIGYRLEEVCRLCEAPLFDVSQALQRTGIYATQTLIVGKIPTREEWGRSH